MARNAAAGRSLPMYKRIVFDRLLLAGVIFLSLAYIMRGTWGGVFTEAATFMLGTVWAVRAMSSSPRVTFRLLAALVLVLLWALLALYLGQTNGLLDF
jgi:hypothetical protein